MPAKAEKGLIVREHQREAVELPSEFCICEAHAGQVHFTPASDSVGPHTIACTTVDISSGGAGVESRHFLPRMCEGVLRIYNAGGSSTKRQILLEEPVKVRRVEMMGREGRYALGLAFVNRRAGLESSVSTVLGHLKGEAEEVNDA